MPDGSSFTQEDLKSLQTLGFLSSSNDEQEVIFKIWLQLDIINLLKRGIKCMKGKGTPHKQTNIPKNSGFSTGLFSTGV